MPRPEDFPKLLDKIVAGMKQPFDFTQEVRGLQVPTMGEGRPKGGHALAILPGLTHYNLAVSPLFVDVTLAFLDAPEKASSRSVTT